MTADNQIVPAAIYVRMSTEHQQYSLENQSTAIRRYAESHGFALVRTYSDPAKSGLLLKNRRSGCQTIAARCGLQIPLSLHDRLQRAQHRCPQKLFAAGPGAEVQIGA
jgi:predicted site-specific integrase-resolvase